MAVKPDLLSPAFEVSVVTTKLDAMVDRLEGFRQLAPQGVVGFPGGPQRCYSTPRSEPVAPGGGRNWVQPFGGLDDAESKR